MEFNELDNIQNGAKKAPEKKEKKSNKKAILITIGAGAVVVLVVLLVFFIVGLIKGNEGKKLAINLKNDLGKSIAMAEKNTDVTLKLSSQNTALKDIVNYDYIYEASSEVKVGGIKMPEWAVFVTVDGNDKISSVVYYDFKVLKKNWKGQKAAAPIECEKIAYNMTKKEVDKLVTVSPLATTYSNDDTVTYLYKYYALDENGNEQAVRLSITYSIEDVVRGYEYRESDFMAFIFG